MGVFYMLGWVRVSIKVHAEENIKHLDTAQAHHQDQVQGASPPATEQAIVPPKMHSRTVGLYILVSFRQATSDTLVYVALNPLHLSRTGWIGFPAVSLDL